MEVGAREAVRNIRQLNPQAVELDSKGKEFPDIFRTKSSFPEVSFSRRKVFWVGGSRHVGCLTEGGSNS